MPELPEVETVRADLAAVVTGRVIANVAAPGVHRLRRHTPAADLVPNLTGRRVVAVGRHGKYLLVHLDSGAVVVAHLGMSGQLLAVADPATPRPPHTHVTVDWEGGGQLRLVDPRTFGELWVSAPVGGVVPELAHLGPDALDPAWTARQAAARLLVRHTRLKPLLMDQRFLAGIGNIYADEILWAARLHPDRPAASLELDEVRRLWRARRATLSQAVAHRGSTLGDGQYRDLVGGLGGYQDHHRAYGREGCPCHRCRTPIRRSRAGGRSTHWCPRCQPAGDPPPLRPGAQVWPGGRGAGG